MSSYENVVIGKLKLKGRALDAKAAGGIKKKKKHKNQVTGDGVSKGGNRIFPLRDQGKDDINEANRDDEKGQGGTEAAMYDDHLTPAERRYLQQWEKLDLQRLAKAANKSHRDRIQEFNQYLANLTDHYDIPKVGPG